MKLLYRFLSMLTNCNTFIFLFINVLIILKKKLQSVLCVQNRRQTMVWFIAIFLKQSQGDGQHMGKQKTSLTTYIKDVRIFIVNKVRSILVQTHFNLHAVRILLTVQHFNANICFCRRGLYLRDSYSNRR